MKNFKDLVSERVAKLPTTNSINKQKKSLNLSNLSNQKQKVRRSTVVEQLCCSLSLIFYNDTKKEKKNLQANNKKSLLSKYEKLCPLLCQLIHPATFFRLTHLDIKRCNKIHFVRKDRRFLYLACSCTGIHVKLKKTWKNVKFLKYNMYVLLFS